MEISKKIMFCQRIIGEEIDDDVVSACLTIARNRILERLYPFDLNKTIEDIPERYDGIECELACRIYLRRGAEGEISHNENGINRTYDSVDDSDLLDKISPFARV